MLSMATEPTTSRDMQAFRSAARPRVSGGRRVRKQNRPALSAIGAGTQGRPRNAGAIAGHGIIPSPMLARVHLYRVSLRCLIALLAAALASSSAAQPPKRYEGMLQNGQRIGGD